ncbi:MAG: glycosyltransferase family 2 protein [Hyphomicrobiales bacterium]|nr:glycosyltransferase family 2 protein [Hyphomicrobiales bacterium]MBV8826108.1 glycosyltransferase family 2 protein [Hyphomicrobiales bacterium]MBV9429193.1 glycosyltransferase family 2 protein [Bradyrhizobiaceae bacterium]
MASHSPAGVRYSIVIPIFNEEAVLPILLRRVDALMNALDGPAETIFVDDGSTDCSSIVLEAKARDDHRCRYLGLTRNFGHQIAITAGMDAAKGDAVVVMDADLQDPPEVVLDMIAKWKEGYHIVSGRRLARDGESAFKRWTADLFYRLLGRVSAIEIPSDVGDFRLIDRQALDAFRAMPEHDRFVRGMFAWLGFRAGEVAFRRPPRAAGETKYPLRKMLRLAVNGVIGFSDAPLRLAIWAGMSVSGLALLYGLYVIGLSLSGSSNLVTGWSSTIVIVSFLCGINMLMTGIVGLYVGRIHAEVKGRPLYVVGRRIGFERERAAVDGPSEQIAAVARLR